MNSLHPPSSAYCLAVGKTYCNYCPGYCCYRLQGATLYLDATDINRIARHFGISDGEVRSRYIEDKNTFKVRADGSCIFLSNSRFRARCTIHAARPQQCREFPYDKPCPYLENEKLLAQIQPRIEAALLKLRGQDT
jgi:Fe-S-cluster containining protein